jgi:hypothetical protein
MMSTFSKRLSIAAACALGLGTAWLAAQPHTEGPAVTVVNGPTNPVPVTGIVGVTKTIDPVRVLVKENIPAGRVNNRFEDFYTVPDGKRLVVEHLSCGMLLQTPDTLNCGIEDPQSLLGHTTGPAHTISGGNQYETVRTGQAVKVIFGPGETFHATVYWNHPTTDVGGLAVFALGGYLEDAQ